MPRITLKEASELLEESTRLSGLISAQEHAEQEENWIEARAEREAEAAWLRAAESAGWEEAYLESLLESGLISRY